MVICRPPTSPEPPRGVEGGYALIGALWLLLLAAVLAGALMMRSVSSAREAARLRADIVDQTRIDSAVESAMADILINGGQSAVIQNRGTITYRFSGNDVSVHVSSERERIDINDAPIEVIDAALQAHHIGPLERRAISGALVAIRARRQRIGSLAQFQRIVAISSADPSNKCLINAFTAAGGRSTARPYGDEQSRALTIQAGAALRLSIDTDRQHMLVVVQPSTLGRDAFGTLERLAGPNCQ